MPRGKDSGMPHSISPGHRWPIVPKVPRSSCSKYIGERKPPPFQAAALARAEFYLHTITLAKVSAGRANSSVSAIAQVVGDFVVSRRAIVRHDNCAAGLHVAAHANGRRGRVGIAIGVARSPSTPACVDLGCCGEDGECNRDYCERFHSVFCCSGCFLRWQH